MNVNIGGVGSKPKKAVTGETVPLFGVGEVLSELCTRGSTYGRSSGQTRSSYVTAREKRRGSFLRRSTAPLRHSEYVSVKG